MFQPILKDKGFSPSLLSPEAAPAPRERRPAGSPPAATRPLPPTAAPSAAAAPAPGEAAPPAGPTEEEIGARIAAAEARVRAELAAELAAAQAAAAQEQALARALLETLEQERVQQAEEARAMVGELVLETVRRLVGEQPFLRDKMLRNMLDEAAGHLLGEREVVLRVRTDQVALARGLVADRVGWSVREDAAIRAGLRVEAARGTLDATLNTALEGISEAIDDWLESAR